MRQLEVWGDLRMAVSKILRRRSPVQCLTRADVVIDPLPFCQGWVEGLEVQISQIDFIELLRMGSLGPFHMAVKLGAAWWQDEES